MTNKRKIILTTLLGTIGIGLILLFITQIISIIIANNTLTLHIERAEALGTIESYATDIALFRVELAEAVAPLIFITVGIATLAIVIFGLWSNWFMNIEEAKRIAEVRTKIRLEKKKALLQKKLNKIEEQEKSE